MNDHRTTALILHCSRYFGTPDLDLIDSHFEKFYLPDWITMAYWNLGYMDIFELEHMAVSGRLDHWNFRIW